MVKRWLRRGTALVLAAATLVTVAAAADDSTPDGGSAAKWLLRWTLGSWLPSDGLSPATALVLGQSPLLLSARSDVADFTAGQQDTPEEPEPEQEQEPDTPAVKPQTPLPASPRTALAFQDNGVPSQTVKITNTAGYTVVRGVCIKNGSNKTLDAAALGCSGQALAEVLRQHGIECEYADPRYLVLMFTPENPPQDYDRLREAITACCTARPLGSAPAEEDTAGNFAALARELAEKDPRCTIREAIFAPQEVVPAEEALGRVCAMPTVSCPPAIPIVVSGEMVSREAVTLMKRYGVENVAVIK